MNMVMEIKPPMSQGPTEVPYDQNMIDEAQEKKSGAQEESSTPGNVQPQTDTVHALKQAGTEAKASMKTTESFLQQSLADQLHRSIGTLKSPKSNGAPTFGSPVMQAWGGTANTKF